MFTPSKFSRKPFYVDAVQVTTDNMDEVAKWANGEILSNPAKPAENGMVKAAESFIKIPVRRALGERQTQAFVGDWVLYAGKGFKIYTPKAFEKCFVAVSDEAYVEQAVRTMTVHD